MTKLKFFILLILVGQSLIGFSQTQTELTTDSNQRLKMAKAEMTSVYNKILMAYSDDKEFIKNIKESQALWNKFKTTELKAKFPDREPGYYGSAHQMCVNDYLTELTNERTKRLQTWLSGLAEGDVCAGSVKMNQ